MKVKDLFLNDIVKREKAIVKADAVSVFHVSTSHFETNFERISSHILEDSTVVWISGYFGSGKSHLLNYLKKKLAYNTCLKDMREFDGSLFDYLNQNRDVEVFLLDEMYEHTPEEEVILGAIRDFFSLHPHHKIIIASQKKLKSDYPGVLSISLREDDIESIVLKTLFVKEDGAFCWELFRKEEFKLLTQVIHGLKVLGVKPELIASGPRIFLDLYSFVLKKHADDDASKLIPFSAFYPYLSRFIDSRMSELLSKVSPSSFEYQTLECLILLTFTSLKDRSVEKLSELMKCEMPRMNLALNTLRELGISIDANGNLS